MNECLCGKTIECYVCGKTIWADGVYIGRGLWRHRGCDPADAPRVLVVDNDRRAHFEVRGRRYGTVEFWDWPPERARNRLDGLVLLYRRRGYEVRDGRTK